jgi:hypothetical protein
MEDMYEKQKQSAGAFAMILWIGMGIYLFATNDAASFISWQGAIYFIGGMFASALVLGTAAYSVQRATATILMSVFSTPSAGAAVIIQGIGIVLMVVEAVVIYYIAEWVIKSFLFPF